MEDQSISLIAKLLANENVNVVRASVRTAAFDVEKRTLFLPMWKELTMVVDQMLVAHEVSHALYSPRDYGDIVAREISEGYPYAQTYINVIEDVRVERLMKDRYPGIRKTFLQGYQELNDQDFFDVRTRDLSTLPLIDRINLYFKAGYQSGVKFSASERPFLTQIERAESLNDVVEIARAVYNHSAQQNKIKIKSNKFASLAQPHDEDEDEYEYDLDGGDTLGEYEDEVPPDSDSATEPDEEDSAESEGTVKSEDARDREEDPESKAPPDQGGVKGSNDNQQASEQEEVRGDESVTASSFEQRVKDLADVSTLLEYYTLGKMQYNPIVTYSQVFELTKQRNWTSNPAHIHHFKQNHGADINYLAKEFDMKKAAAAFKRMTTAKVGQLDMDKVWSYKLKDDLFRRVSVVKQGKNHGMIFLLDWSGSMQPVIDQTLDQVANLAMFCYRVNIPFEVFAFADGATHLLPEKERETANAMMYSRSKNSTVLDPNNHFVLIELFSSKMTSSEFNNMVGLVANRSLSRVIKLNGTPLNHSLIHIYHYIETFLRKHNVEKMSLVTLTDGSGECLGSLHTSTGFYRTNRKTFIRDEVTKKTYPVQPNATHQTNVLLTMIRDRYHCRVLGFYICPTRSIDLIGALRSNLNPTDFETLHSTKTLSATVDHIRSTMRAEGFYGMKNTGRDELFLVSAASMHISSGQLEVDGDASSRAIAKKFNQYMNRRKTSRVLLSRFIDYIA